MTFIPLREPTSVPSGHLTDSSYRWLSIRECRFPAFVISSESEKSFSFAVKKGCERSGQWETLCSLYPGRTVFHADRSTREREHGKRKRSLGSARDDDTRVRFPHVSFHPASEANLRPFGPPPSSGRMERCESPPSLKDGTKKRSPCGLRSLISKTTH